MSAGVEARWLGRIPYDAAWELQKQHRDRRIDGQGSDVVFTLEHPPVLTAGRRARPENLRVSTERLDAEGVQLRFVERGGDWTFHGPGQLVAYPIVSLVARGLRVPEFVALLEAALVSTANQQLASGGAEGRFEVLARPGFPGLWATDGGRRWKVGAVGIHVERGVSWHGVALNLRRESWGFDFILPCGLAGEETTALETLVALVGGNPEALSVEHAASQFSDALIAALCGRN